MNVSTLTNEIMVLKEGSFTKKASGIFAIIFGLILLIIVDEINLGVVVGSLFFAAFGAFIFLFSKDVHVLVDKMKMTITKKEKSILKENIDQFNIHDVSHINVQTVERYENYNEGHTSRRVTYNIFLVLRDNRTVLLNYQKGSWFRLPFTKSKDQETGQKLANFIGVPYNETYKDGSAFGDDFLNKFK